LFNNIWKNISITVFTTSWNTYDSGLYQLIDYYLNELKVDKFIYADNYSTYNTIEKLNIRFFEDKRLKICMTPYIVFSDQEATNLANSLLESDENDVFIFIDSDEIIYHPNFKSFLLENKKCGKCFLSNFLTNVFNHNDIIDNNIPFIENFTLCQPISVQKTPIIIKQNKNQNIKFGGGHHFVINKQYRNDYVKNHKITIDTFIIYHFCYLNKKIWIERKKKKRAKITFSRCNHYALYQGK
jgi:hypothetical protein